MRIEFDPTNPDEAAAVRAMITAMQPTAPRYDPTAQPAKFLEGAGFNDLGNTPSAQEQMDALAEQHDASVDSDGTPWDARIHSTPPTTNKDGTWRAKRGVKAEEIAAVRAEREAQPEELGRVEEEVKEILATEPPLAPAQEQSAPRAPNAPVGEQSAPPAPPAPTGQSEAPLAPAATPTAPADTAPTTQSAPVAPSSPSFLDVMKAITAAQKDGKIDTAKVKELCAAVGAGESTMGLNGADKGELRVAFMALLSAESGE